MKGEVKDGGGDNAHMRLDRTPRLCYATLRYAPLRFAIWLHVEGSCIHLGSETGYKYSAYRLQKPTVIYGHESFHCPSLQRNGCRRI